MATQQVGNPSRQLGRALKRQVSGQPVGLARDIFICPGLNPAASSRHAARGLMSQYQSWQYTMTGPGPVRLTGAGVQLFEREIDHTGRCAPVVVLRGRRLNQLRTLAGQLLQVIAPYPGRLIPDPGSPVRHSTAASRTYPVTARISPGARQQQDRVSWPLTWVRWDSGRLRSLLAERELP